MTILKKIGILILGVILILAIPSMITGLVSDGENPDWLLSLILVAQFIWVIGGIIYIAVDAAMRHNRSR